MLPTRSGVTRHNDFIVVTTRLGATTGNSARGSCSGDRARLGFRAGAFREVFVRAGAFREVFFGAGAFREVFFGAGAGARAASSALAKASAQLGSMIIRAKTGIVWKQNHNCACHTSITITITPAST